MSTNHDSSPLTGLGESEELDYAVSTCARCGYCKQVCTTHPYGNGFEAFSPRAKVHFLNELRNGRAELTPEWVDRLYQCTTCERCQEVCQTDIPLVELWEAARAETVKRGLGPMPVHLKFKEFADKNGNAYGEPNEERGRWMLPEHRPAEGAELLVFGGCTGSFKMPAMLRTGVSILQRQGIPFAYAGPGELCCGSPILRTGQIDSAKRLIAGNLDTFHRLGVKQVVTPCGGCSKTLKHDYPRWAKELGKPWEVEVLHFSEIYVRLLREGRLKPKKAINRKITYHDPCHLGRSQGIFDEPREILAAIPGVELVEMENVRADSRCCGAGGGVRANYAAMANDIAEKRIKEAIATGADTLATMCPFCQSSFAPLLQKMGNPLQLVGVEELLLQSMEE
ncbi:(Fe-S)-binding protein [Geomonas subterranea]|uniref:(Fe-S)-binding protein n=1 Tax=Geomonas subterranea TaxID=2847989 RepID=A0ABX8LMU7_9BACT|nr:(Fe-S)-binding protein [Geomonas subterranea]QXE92651.1 (Fe-S)-binding protein [Geomonas subterranea]QXM09250.1 (Fe-S)-binding protein [Geomonas subterranea]